MIVLITGLFEAPLIAAVTWLLLRVLTRTNAATRYGAWFAALLVSAIFPVLTAPHIVVSSLTSNGARVVFGLWALGVAVMAARAGAALHELNRCKRNAFPLDAQQRTRIHNWRSAHFRARDLRLCVSDEVDIPSAVGLFDAMVVLPQWLLRDASPAEIDRLVVHEVAHLRRYDDWTKLVQIVIECVLFFNPAIRWIAAQMELEREVACDDVAVDMGADETQYASSLMRIARNTGWASRFALAPSLFAARRTLSVRIERLLGRHDASRGVSARVLSANLATFAAAFLMFRALSPIATLAITAPQDNAGVRAQALSIYGRLLKRTYPAPSLPAAGRYWPQALETIAALGMVRNVSLVGLERGSTSSTYVYDVRAHRGDATLRADVDRAGRIASSNLEARASGERYMRAYVAATVVPTPSPQDEANIALSTAIVNRVGDSIWPGWTKTPFAIALLTANGPAEINFTKPAPVPSLPPQVEATFPLANGVPTIVIGEPQYTQANTPIRWSVTLIHEHFHQWQNSWPPYFAGVKNLGLAPANDGANWMLNYPFPYNDARVQQAYAKAADALRDAVDAIGTPHFNNTLSSYLRKRTGLRAVLHANDYKYFAFQCWQEGTARYTEIAVARIAAQTHMNDRMFLTGAQAQALAADSIATRGRVMRTLGNPAALRDDKRVAFYAYGAAEALLLDAVSRGWHSEYLDPRMDLGNLFRTVSSSSGGIEE